MKQDAIQSDAMTVAQFKELKRRKLKTAGNKIGEPDGAASSGRSPEGWRCEQR